MKALVIGGMHFTGAHVVRCLHDRETEITVLHRGRATNPILPDVDHIVNPSAEYPITTFPDVVRSDWDIIVHMVAIGELDGRSVQCLSERVGTSQRTSL